MKEIILEDKTKVLLYEGSDELLIERYQKFQKYLMIEGEIGSSFADYDKRMSKTREFLKADMVKEAMQELNNQRQLVFNVFTEYNPKSRAMAYLVHSIDGKVYGYTTAEIDEIIERLNSGGLTKGELDNTTDEVKKKSSWRLSNIFRRG